jgi:thymidylate synthase
MFLDLPDLRHGYVDVCREVMRRGARAAPRGLQTLEVLGATLRVADPGDVLPVGVGRKVSPKLAALEALQLVGGYSDAGQAKRVSPALAGHEDLGRFHGAYGPRVLPQLWPAVRRLVQDRESRRAVVNVWDPVQDLLVDDVKNYPCVTQLQLLLREEGLTLHVSMRANDAWRGLAYDAFTFAQLQLTVARVLGVRPGPYIHHAVSLHLYEEDWERAEGLERRLGAPPPVDGFGARHRPTSSLYLAEGRTRAAVGRARRIGAGGELAAPTPSEQWYLEVLGEYL